MDIISICLLFMSLHTAFWFVVARREQELYEMKQYILYSNEFNSAVRNVIDDQEVFIAGFSYGAATSSLSVVTHPDDYKACILLDGWFHVDPSGTGGYDFPEQAHAKGI